jgi:hypothetical protein
MKLRTGVILVAVLLVFGCHEPPSLDVEDSPETLFARAHNYKSRGEYGSAVGALRELQARFPDFQPAQVSAVIEEVNSLAAERYTSDMPEREPDSAGTGKDRDPAERLVKSTDEIRGTNVYYHPSTRRTNNQNVMYAYVGERDNVVWLRLRMSYAGPHWLFVESLLFTVDGELFVLDFKTFDWERDQSAARLWEWVDMPVDARTWRLINRIATAKEAMMRYEGHQYYSDREVIDTEKQMLRAVISAYQRMGGKPPSE